jgi:hypothetical protein
MNIIKTLLIACIILFSPALSFANEETITTGTVAETMESGGYVYVRLQEDDSWLASSPIPVSVGDTVVFKGGALMKDFHSRTLNRDFEFIQFVMNLQVVNDNNANGHSRAEGKDPHTVANSAVAPVAGEIIPIDGGKTITEIYAGIEQLKDQQIMLRARVMKVSMNIVNKNWITLQDGTGTEPDNKLIATTSEVVAVGDLVTVTGVVQTDVDLGSGYNYSVLLEEATFTK